MTFIDFIGLAAGLCVLLAFYMKNQRNLRLFSILSNLLFVAYAWHSALYPILVLHVILLPLNLYRMSQMRAPTDGGEAGTQDAGSRPRSLPKMNKHLAQFGMPGHAAA